MNDAVKNKTVAVVGLGYVGLPLALAFGKKLNTIGFDISKNKLAAYRRAEDLTGEMEPSAFKQASHIFFSNKPEDLKKADFIVVAVPTPIDSAKQPDLTPLIKATETIAPNIKEGAIIIYESTVYPGVTDEVCAPLLEKNSGKKRGEHFFLGYSPERINPGDKEHRLENITKVVSGENPEVLDKVAVLYETVVEVGVYKASSIRVAEAAKVIENTQRDVNIALINELALIFNELDIDTHEVLEAAGTKWNFLPFKPGLVGGHCIGVDPYYLTYKAQEIGYQPEVILAGRRINDGMGKFIAEETVKQLVKTGRPVKGAKVLMLGITFKENCSDIRNTRAIDIVRELVDYSVDICVWDPVANVDETFAEYGIKLINNWQVLDQIDTVVAAVSHDEIISIDLVQLAKKMGEHKPFIDVKGLFEQQKLIDLGFTVWRL